MSEKPPYINRSIQERLDSIERHMRSLTKAGLFWEEYQEVFSAASTPEAKTVMHAEGLSGPKQLLLTALQSYLDRPRYMTEQEEQQFLKTRDRMLASRNTPSGKS